jgi:hypothetical protein
MSYFRKLTLAVIIGFAGLSVQATTYTFAPNDFDGDADDMLDLDHYKYFTWGFKNFTIPAGEHITSAKLSIFNINNWTADENGYWVGSTHVAENWLNMWLLDSVSSTHASTSGKLKVYDDNDGGPDYFATWNASAKVKIATYTDWSGGNSGDVVTLNYDFAAAGVLDELESYIANANNFAIGLDPDCHYWNTGVQLIIVTSPNAIPETTGSLGLLGLGLGVIALARRYLAR